MHVMEWSYLEPPGGKRCGLLHPCGQESEQRRGQQRSEAPAASARTSGSLTAPHGCDITPPGKSNNNNKKKKDLLSEDCTGSACRSTTSLPPHVSAVCRCADRSAGLCGAVRQRRSLRTGWWRQQRGVQQLRSAPFRPHSASARGLVSHYSRGGRGSAARRANENQTRSVDQNHLLQPLEKS